MRACEERVGHIAPQCNYCWVEGYAVHKHFLIARRVVMYTATRPQDGLIVYASDSCCCQEVVPLTRELELL
jgi:hypothetical protein